MQPFDETKPIYLQIKERIEEQIMNGLLREDEQIPSIARLVDFYRINHLTISKGIHLLVEDGILYKKRGLGMFVAKGAQQKLLQQRKDRFVEAFVDPLLKEAEQLGMTEEQLVLLIKERKEGRKS